MALVAVRAQGLAVGSITTIAERVTCPSGANPTARTRGWQLYHHDGEIAKYRRLSLE